MQRAIQFVASTATTELCVCVFFIAARGFGRSWLPLIQMFRSACIYSTESLDTEYTSRAAVLKRDNPALLMCIYWQVQSPEVLHIVIIIHPDQRKQCQSPHGASWKWAAVIPTGTSPAILAVAITVF